MIFMFYIFMNFQSSKILCYSFFIFLIPDKCVLHYNKKNLFSEKRIFQPHFGFLEQKQNKKEN